MGSCSQTCAALSACKDNWPNGTRISAKHSSFLHTMLASGIVDQGCKTIHYPHTLCWRLLDYLNLESPRFFLGAETCSGDDSSMFSRRAIFFAVCFSFLFPACMCGFCGFCGFTMLYHALQRFTMLYHALPCFIYLPIYLSIYLCIYPSYPIWSNLIYSNLILIKS